MCAQSGSWQVSRILPRTVTLTSAGGGELQLEMKVHDAKIEPPAKPVEKSQAAADGVSGDESLENETEPLSRAEEIRQRIAERREELRQEAEQADTSVTQDEPASYEDAIQSMIGRNRGQKSGNENEQ